MVILRIILELRFPTFLDDRFNPVRSFPGDDRFLEELLSLNLNRRGYSARNNSNTTRDINIGIKMKLRIQLSFLISNLSLRICFITVISKCSFSFYHEHCGLLFCTVVHRSKHPFLHTINFLWPFI